MTRNDPTRDGVPLPRAADDPNPFIRSLAWLVARGGGTWAATTRELRQHVAEVVPSLRLGTIAEVDALRAVLATNEVSFGRNLRKWVPAIEEAGLSLQRIRRYRRDGLPGSADERVWVLTSREVLDGPPPSPGLPIILGTDASDEAEPEAPVASADAQTPPAYPGRVIAVVVALGLGTLAATIATFFVGG